MTTIRVAARKRFTQVDRKCINDRRLSFKARGILVWLLDKPDDWETTAKRIEDQGTEGREAVNGALKELEGAGYLARRTYRGGDGKWSSEWTVHESPPSSEVSPVYGFPSPETRHRKPVDKTKTETNTENAAGKFPQLKARAIAEGRTCHVCNGGGVVELNDDIWDQCSVCSGRGFDPSESTYDGVQSGEPA